MTGKLTRPFVVPVRRNKRRGRADVIQEVINELIGVVANRHGADILSRLINNDTALGIICFWIAAFWRPPATSVDHAYRYRRYRRDRESNKVFCAAGYVFNFCAYCIVRPSGYGELYWLRRAVRSDLSSDLHRR